MKRIVLALVLVATPAAADVAELDRSVEATRADGKYAFCTDPPKLLLGRQRALCPLAETVPDCAALRAACQTPPKKDAPSWLRELVKLIAPIAKILLYLLVLAIALVVAVPLVQTFRRRRLAERVKPIADRANVASPIVTARTAHEDRLDPEVALAAADAEHRRGDDRRALSLYLAASLVALERRGVLRLGAHRTNGEYVRACRDEAAQPELRAIVGQIDRVDFGGEDPTEESVTDVAGRARSLVRAVAIALVVLSCVGCGGGRRGNDPAGNELPTEVVRRNGFHVTPLATSLATLPVENAAEAPVTVVDLERVILEDEARIHLERWVEAGGTLVLLGRPELWPRGLDAERILAHGRTIHIDSDASEELDEPVEATLARPEALTWTTARELATTGDELYAGIQPLGEGLVLGIANDDLFTNLGVLAPHNGAALVTLLRAVAHDSRRTAQNLDAIQIAQAEDGIPPPSNPFTALAAAGLAKGAWHALAAALLLFLAFGIRHSRPRPVRAAARRAFAEHVQATGALYAKTDAKLHALRVYGKFVELRLRELPPDVEKLLARAREENDTAVGDEFGVLEELRSAVATRLRR